MDYYNLYKSMIDDKYIKLKSIYHLEITKLQIELANSTNIIDALRIMTYLNMYKIVLESSVSINNFKNKYNHARLSFTWNDKRIFITHYIGKIGNQYSYSDIELKIKDKAIIKLKQII
jgi:hypothetical protein